MYWIYLLCPTNAFMLLFKNLRFFVEPNGHLSTKLKLAAFFGTGTRFYANFEAIAVFYYEQSSIYIF